MQNEQETSIEEPEVEVPETETEEVAESAEAEQSEAAPDTETESKADRRKPGAERRIRELTWKAHEAERRAEAEAEARARAEAEIAKYREGKVAGKPEPANFESYEQYLEALTDWKVEQKQAANRDVEVKAAQKAELAKYQAKLNATVEAGQAKYNDFDAVSEQFVAAQPPKTLVDAIIDSDRGEDLAYYLGKNPVELARIAGLSPFGMARELGKIEAKLDSVKRPTSAPAPAKTLKGNGGRVPSNEPPTDPEEYRKWRAKQK